MDWQTNPYNYRSKQQAHRSNIEDLLIPLHQQPVKWDCRKATASEVSTANGVNVKNHFPDKNDLLFTAFDDFNKFLSSGKIRADGKYKIRIIKDKVNGQESYRININKSECVITAEETEGVRRALVWLEDEMLCRNRAALPLKTITRTPVIKTRMLAESLLMRKAGVKIPPEEFCNRLAHQGINAVWISRGCLYPHRIVPEFEVEPQEFFKVLRERVHAYGNYGIKVFVYSMEPAAIPVTSQLCQKYPQILGSLRNNVYNYCTSSSEGRQQIVQSFRRLFTEVPKLGGYITICVGESPTHCYSQGITRGNITCPRCSRRKPEAVLADTLSAIESGIHAGNPDAELIAWPYMQNVCWGEKETVKAAACIPENIVLMHNFENSGRKKQLGKVRLAEDYWLSYAGPSKLFKDCAETAISSGTRIFAKLMVACSHELQSVPYIPVPGIVYEKFMAARKLGVSGVMMNWGAGNAPNLMLRSAGELSFTPTLPIKDDFLFKIAERDWSKHAGCVVQAWKYFQKGYENYPLTVAFSYYGPMHNGIVWPLYLIPRDLSLPRNWMPDHFSGDRIGECTGFHTLNEVITLCERMHKHWHKGILIMQDLIPFFKNNRDRMNDILVAQALDIQIKSSLNILRFYAFREKLAQNRRSHGKIQLLESMRQIVRDEIALSKKMMPLIKKYPRLGYTPEAQIYKYNNRKLAWRIACLKKLLKNEFPAVKKLIIKQKKIIFPHYTGQEPQGKICYCPLHEIRAKTIKFGPAGRRTYLSSWHDGKNIFFRFQCQESCMKKLRVDADDKGATWSDDRIWINIEISQFKPLQRFLINARGSREYFYARGINVNDPQDKVFKRTECHKEKYYNWQVTAHQEANRWDLVVRIPLGMIGHNCKYNGGPLRLNMGRDAGSLTEREHFSWVKSLKTCNRVDLGWLIFLKN